MPIKVNAIAPSSAPAVLVALMRATWLLKPPPPAARVNGKLAPHKIVAGSIARPQRSASKANVDHGDERIAGRNCAVGCSAGSMLTMAQAPNAIAAASMI